MVVCQEITLSPTALLLLNPQSSYGFLFLDMLNRRKCENETDLELVKDMLFTFDRARQVVSPASKLG